MQTSNDAEPRRAIYYHPQKNELIRYHYSKKNGVSISSSEKISVRNLLYLSQTPEEAGWVKIGMDLPPLKKFWQELWVSRSGRYMITIRNACGCHDKDYIFEYGHGMGASRSFRSREEFLRFQKGSGWSKVKDIGVMDKPFNHVKKEVRKLNLGLPT